MKIKHNLYFAQVALFMLCSLFAFAQLLHAQNCRNDITPTTPTQDFTLHGDGTVTHNKTGLMWMRCAMGQHWNGTACTGEIQGYTWIDRIQFFPEFPDFVAENPGIFILPGIKELTSDSFAGYSDWRLPNIKELASIVEQACVDPAINTAVFPAAPSATFWSASAETWYGFAWFVHFTDGAVNIAGDIYGSSFVRLVRGGE